MSIIAVDNVPYKWAMKGASKNLVKIIKGPFEALNFEHRKPVGGQFPPKILYLRLSEKLDPQVVLEKINTGRVIQGAKLHAYIPDHVPDLPLASSKNKKIGLKKHGKNCSSLIEKPEDILVLAHTEIMYEMQYKYTGLFELSKKNGHTLLEEITHTIFERLMRIMDTNNEAGESSFNLTKAYRRSHPHFGDFQLILSTLQQDQDLNGVPRTQITEQEISVVNTQPSLVGNIPYGKVKGACEKYSNTIVKKVSDHVKELNCEIKTETDTEEEIAKKKVRVELKKLEPYLSTIIRQIITDSFVPERSPYHKFRIYGEPFLPPKETMEAFLRRYKPVKVHHSDRMYNLLRMYISLANYGSIMAMDGTVLGGAKLVIRPSEQPMYKIPHSFIKEMRQAITGGYKPTDSQPQAIEKQELAEDWVEPWE